MIRKLMDMLSNCSQIPEITGNNNENTDNQGSCWWKNSYYITAIRSLMKKVDFASSTQAGVGAENKVSDQTQRCNESLIKAIQNLQQCPATAKLYKQVKEECNFVIRCVAPEKAPFGARFDVSAQREASGKISKITSAIISISEDARKNRGGVNQNMPIEQLLLFEMHNLRRVNEFFILNLRKDLTEEQYVIENEKLEFKSALETNQIMQECRSCQQAAWHNRIVDFEANFTTSLEIQMQSGHSERIKEDYRSLKKI